MSSDGLSEEARAGALRRFYQLRPFLEEAVPLAQGAREQHLAVSTAKRWVARYQQAGLAGLARKPRADRGQRRGLSLEAQQMIAGLALQRPVPSVATIHRHVSALADEQGWQRPSYSQVYAIVRQLDPALVTLAHAGPKVYSETFDLLYRREASRPNELWQADHTLLGLWLRQDDGTPLRPWLTVILDDYSRAVAGYMVNAQAPSALHTALALRESLLAVEDTGVGSNRHVLSLPNQSCAPTRFSGRRGCYSSHALTASFSLRLFHFA